MSTVSTLLGYSDDRAWVESTNAEAAAGVDVDGGQSAAVASAMYLTDGVLASQLRSTHGLKLNNVSISSGGGVASASMVVASAPTGLRPNQKVWLTTGATNLTSGNTEVVQVSSSYVPGSTTVPLNSAIANSGHTTMLWSSSAYAGPQTGLILPGAMLPAAQVLFDPATGFYALTVAATQDAQLLKNVPEVAIGVYNGATLDRLTGTNGAANFTLTAQVGNGSSLYSAASAGAKAAVKTSAGTLYSLYVVNSSGADAYVQLFNVALAGVTLGSTVPNVQLYVPTAGIAASLPLPQVGLNFATAISIGSTTTSGGATPSSAGVSVYALYI